MDDMTYLEAFGGSINVPKQQICDASPSLAQNLKEKAVVLRQRLADLDAAVKALEENPQIASVFELLRKVNRY